MDDFPSNERKLKLIIHSLNNRANNLTSGIRQCKDPVERIRLLQLQKELRSLGYEARQLFKTRYPNSEGEKND